MFHFTRIELNQILIELMVNYSQIYGVSLYFHICLLCYISLLLEGFVFFSFLDDGNSFLIKNKNTTFFRKSKEVKLNNIVK